MGVVRLPPVFRGEIWLTELDPTVGREIRKTRPCLVVSPNSMNRHLDTVTIMPLTSGSKPAPFRVPTTFDGMKGFLLGEQLRTADRHRFRRKLGILDPATVQSALSVLREMFEE